MHPQSPCFLVSRPCALRPDGGVGGWAHSRPALIFASLFLAQTRPTRCVRALFALVCLFAMSPSPRRCRTLASRLASRLARMLGLGPPPSKLQKQRNDLPPLAFREIARFCVEPRDVAALARTCRAAADACADRLGELRVVPARGRTYDLHANGRCDVTPKGKRPFRLSGVVGVTEADRAFAALTRSGTVVTWGDSRFGGDSSAVRHLLVDVASVTGADSAFAALTRSGTVVTWGYPGWGGDSATVQHKLVDVASVTAAAYAFAALTRSGAVIAWGYPRWGGDSSVVQHQLVDVASVTAAAGAFAAVTHTGTVVAWGHPAFGGDSSAVQHLLVDVASVTATTRAFAALTRSGTVVTWGYPEGGGDSSAVRHLLVDVISVMATGSAFVALTRAGTVEWGGC